MAKVKLRCGVYHEGSIFSVEIARDADVEALQEKIAGILSSEQHTVPPRLLTLYLARKKEGEETKWMKSNSSLKAYLKKGRRADSDYVEMIPNWTLDDKDYFGENFEPGRKEIHVSVELPEAVASVGPMTRAVFWLVIGSIESALRTKGVRSRLYRIADAELGYYDPANVLSDNVQAFWSTDNDLQIRVLFKEEAHALYFQSRLNAEFILIPITSLVSPAPYPRFQRRIFSRHYVAQEYESPQESMSSVPTEYSVIDPDTPIFKYQRIEAGGFFGAHGKAESAHLISKSHCVGSRVMPGMMMTATIDSLCLVRCMVLTIC